jgi:hypothetical protein
MNEKATHSVPTVIRGEDYEMVRISDGEQIMICLGYDGTPIWICFAIRS